MFERGLLRVCPGKYKFASGYLFKLTKASERRPVVADATIASAMRLRVFQSRGQRTRICVHQMIRYYRVRADTSEREDRGYSGRRLKEPSTVPTNVIQPF